MVERNEIDMVWIETRKQISNILTKALSLNFMPFINNTHNFYDEF